MRRAAGPLGSNIIVSENDPLESQMKATDANSEQSVRDRNILVVGKNSYIGDFLVRHLSAQGARVSAVGSSDCNFLDSDAVHQLFQRFDGEPFTILFLAVVNKTADNSYAAFRDNVQIAWNLVSGARNEKVESLIYFSSVDVYGRSPRLPMNETTPLDPDTWYGLAKAASEWIVREELGSKCPTCILRLPGIFGRAPNDRSIIGRFVSTIRQERKVYLRGDGEILRDYVFAPDLCRAVERLVARKVSGTINLATGQSLSLRQILESIREVFGINFEVVHLPADAERSFDMRYDTAKLCAALGEFDFSPLSAGIRSYL
jgi:nucleoside-diphosphate-sugar epimerase